VDCVRTRGNAFVVDQRTPSIKERRHPGADYMLVYPMRPLKYRSVISFDGLVKMFIVSLNSMSFPR
jgi:hypothetical protein